MTHKTLYGNKIPAKILERAEARFSRYAKKFSFDPGLSPDLVLCPEGQGFEDFGILTVREKKEGLACQQGFDRDNGIMLGTIRMGFGHCRMAIALASASHSMGYTPYWLDLMSFPDYAASKTIKYLEDLYNLGSRISQRSRLFNSLVWEYVTSGAARKLSFSVEEDILSRIFVPLYRDIPKDLPFFSTHPWTGHAAVGAGMSDVVTIIPDNYPLAFHVVEGSVHAVQSPSSYMGYRTFHSMGSGLRLDHTMPSKDIEMVGHYIDHEIVAGIEEDCASRRRRIKDKETRRFLLTMGGAGAQVLRFADIALTCKEAIEDTKVALLINMGDHRGRWKELESLFTQHGIRWTLHQDWSETRAFIDEARDCPISGVHVFLHDDFYCAVYATNLLMRIADVMITKPSELSFYPVPKLFIQRVGRHEAWGAIRGAEIGDGTIETASVTGLHRLLKLLVEDDDLLDLYCTHILVNKKNGVYNGAYNAVKLAVKNRKRE
ncbi:MAG: hypothetical protein JW875_06475 [Spirochaetales bacterium]|nr:hypothetical protein [Spirochaetales bacterium]